MSNNAGEGLPVWTECPTCGLPMLKRSDGVCRNPGCPSLAEPPATPAEDRRRVRPDDWYDDDQLEPAEPNTGGADGLAREVAHGRVCANGAPGACMSIRCGSNCYSLHDRMHPCPACLIAVLATRVREAEQRGAEKALVDLTDEEANAIDFVMGEHMYRHSISNNINGMGCDVGCRTRALSRAVNATLRARADATRSTP